MESACDAVVAGNASPNGSHPACTSSCVTVDDPAAGAASMCSITAFTARNRTAPGGVSAVTNGVCNCYEGGNNSTGVGNLLGGLAVVWIMLCLPDLARLASRHWKSRQQQPAADERPAADDAGRSAGWDNAKFILMICVVCGHAGEPFLALSTQPLASMGLWLNMWVMPAFVFVTGFFSPAVPTPRHHLGTMGIGLTYVLNQSMLVALCILIPQLPITPVACIEIMIGRITCAEPVVGWSNVVTGLFQPTWQMWYLYCLVLWRALTPVFLVLKLPAAIAAALILGSWGGYLPEQPELTRAFAYLPYFVIGAGIRQNPPVLARLDRIMSQRAARPIGAAVLTFWMVVGPGILSFPRPSLRR